MWALTELCLRDDFVEYRRSVHRNSLLALLFLYDFTYSKIKAQRMNTLKIDVLE